MIFVVQKHHASHLHYDFRLEINGVLKSWAVPKGPSCKVNEKRLAILTEDHPLSYAKFEGVIPDGEYGAGKVEIWDNGTFENGKKEALKNCFKKGELSIILHGKKLCGHYVLYNFKEDNWLLIKQKEHLRG
jgi:DNA ligase D-like protein (predicted 3'-phosphoesterase)